jgi:Recombination endonuclease VII
MPPDDEKSPSAAPPSATPSGEGAYRFRPWFEDPLYVWLCQKNKRNYRLKRRNIDNANRRRRRASDPDYRDRERARRYGLTLEEFRAILARQGGVCAICGRGGRRLCVDHCHTTGKVRGFLCSPCNTGLGCYEDNPEFLRAASRYLDDVLGRAEVGS